MYDPYLMLTKFNKMWDQSLKSKNIIAPHKAWNNMPQPTSSWSSFQDYHLELLQVLLAAAYGSSWTRSHINPKISTPREISLWRTRWGAASQLVWLAHEHDALVSSTRQYLNWPWTSTYDAKGIFYVSKKWAIQLISFLQRGLQKNCPTEHASVYYSDQNRIPKRGVKGTYLQRRPLGCHQGVGIEKAMPKCHTPDGKWRPDFLNRSWCLVLES